MISNWKQGFIIKVPCVPFDLVVVSNFVESLDEEEVRRAVRDIRPRAELCIKMDGGHSTK